MGVMKELDVLFKESDIIFKTNWVQDLSEFSASIIGIKDDVARGETLEDCIKNVSDKISSIEIFKDIDTHNIDKLILETKIKALTKELEQAKKDYKKFEK